MLRKPCAKKAERNAKMTAASAALLEAVTLLTIAPAPCPPPVKPTNMTEKPRTMAETVDRANWSQKACLGVGVGEAEEVGVAVSGRIGRKCEGA